MSTDRWIARLIALTVCVVAVVLIITDCVLVARGNSVPDPFAQLLALIVGGLLARLTTGRSPDETQNVQVVNAPADPVPVDPDVGGISWDLVATIALGILVGLLLATLLGGHVTLH